MIYRNYLQKCLFWALLFSSLVSCLAIAKGVSGFNNPKVISKNEVLTETYNRFAKKTNCTDLIYNKATTKDEIINIISKSFNGDLNVYDYLGSQICFDNKIKCSSYNLDSLLKNEALTICENTKNLNTILKNMIDLKTGLKPEKLKLKKNDRVVIFYWSTFVSSKKRIKEEFDYLYNSLNSNKYNYHFYRVNCDLLDEWNLKKGAELKTKFTKIDNRRYDLEFGKLPWK